MRFLPAVLVLAVLFSSLPVRAGEAPPRPAAESPKPTCEHGVQKVLCTRCNPKLAPVFKAIADDLLGQYVLGYYAGDAVRREGFHAVEVRLAPRARRKLRVRQLRAGYEHKVEAK